MKLLSPAGNFESLKLAVNYGADEVYLGINDFNARNNIDGFTLENLKEAVDYAHIFGVKVCLALNVLFTDDELQSAVDVAVKASNLGVDAIIVQDLGLFDILNKNYPQIELHASTQMGIHNLEGVKYVEKLGFKRVVLSRETPLHEIERIRKNSNIEIEYFAHGALCVCFSGNCYLSSYMLSASGNRGKCKQLCRLPYTLEKDGKILKNGYLLSAKDFNFSKRLDELERAGVDVIKIEGRARRPYYVGVTTREYRKALDGLKADSELLKIAFNRNYTAGYFDGNGSIISSVQSHIGIEIGKVIKFNGGKKFNEVFFSSNREVSLTSTLKFFDNKTERCTVSAFDLKLVRNGVYRLTTTNKVAVGDVVRLITDAKSEEQILSVTRKKPIDLDVVLEIGKPIKAHFEIDGISHEFFGDILDRAQNSPITETELKDNFSKSALFDVKLNIVTLEHAFMPKNKLNEFRRRVFEEIYNLITKKYIRNQKSIKVSPYNQVQNFIDFEWVDSATAMLKSKNAVYSPSEYNIDGVNEFVKNCNSQGVKAYLDLPNFASEKDVKILKEIVEKTKIGIIANNYYALTFDCDDIVIGAGLNVYNSYTARFHGKRVLSAESDHFTRIDFPVMTLKHCPIKSHLNCDCKTCKYQDGLVYRMDGKMPLKLKRKRVSECTFYLEKIK